MGLNETPRGERTHIAFFGKRNAGKSSLVNAVTNQNVAIVSDVKGTTTDPVYKSMEILPIGPVMIIDTPGLDDVGTLGNLRVEKTNEVLRKTDIAIIVIDINDKDISIENDLIKALVDKKIPYIIAYNKIDTIDISKIDKKDDCIYLSAEKKINIDNLFNAIVNINKGSENDKPIVRDLVNVNDLVLLVVPIDKAAPKGRLILPQQQVIRELLDNGSIPIIVRDSELEYAIKNYGDKIKLVITDSQVFAYVSKIVPENIPLTSFSVLFSRYKGDFEEQLNGVEILSNLKDGDKVLIAEGCTHKRQCGDIGTEKIPKALKKFTGKNLDIEFTSGGYFPTDVSQYKLIIHCGACMLNDREVKSRIDIAKKSGVKISNYGLFLAKVNGILDRAIKPILKNEAK